MKKGVLIGIVIVIVCSIIGIYFGYKGYALLNYDLKQLEELDYYKTFMDNYKNAETINIKETSNSDYEKISFEGIHIRNDFKEYAMTESEDPFGKGRKYQLHNPDGKYNSESGKFEAAIWISKEKQFVYYLKDDFSIYSGDDKIIKSVGTKESRTAFLEKKNITTDLELMDYLYKTRDEKLSIFTSVQDIKNLYEIHAHSSILFMNNSKITLIKGDIEGTLTSKNNVKICNLYTKDSLYSLTFIGEKFTDAYIEELLNTITID
ncbi:MAG: hypothetical protein K2M17_02885 [Bacilli bacterium]|nr:hypothetical protein [Bacilli bacterium]